MSKHTPGPWKYDYYPEEDYQEVRLVNNSGDVILNGNSKTLELKAVDAALIASAPDLLSALERITDALDASPKHQDIIDDCLKAIAKAKGET